PQTPAKTATSSLRKVMEGTKSKGKVLIDGRVIDPQLEQKRVVPSWSFVEELGSPDQALRIFEGEIVPPAGGAFEAHCFLWPEQSFRLVSRVNDADPRPRLWAEEGIRGLGMQQRLSALQRWSLRAWWDQLEQQGRQPLMAFAGSPIVRDVEHVAFVHDPEYDIFRLYQAAETALKGEYPLILHGAEGVVCAQTALDGVKDRERITPERMREILGKRMPISALDGAFSAIPFFSRTQMQESSVLLDRLREQLLSLFAFPTLSLPHPAGGEDIRIVLGLWEMSQASAEASTLRQQAAQQQTVTLKASAGDLSDLVRRELWRKPGKPARDWPGYTPKQVAEAIRVALRDSNHYDMQGFATKKPGDFNYDIETGRFSIVLRKKRTTHSFLLKGKAGNRSMMGVFVPYQGEGQGFDLLQDYQAFLASSEWQQLCPELVWEEAWLVGTHTESRCLWRDTNGRPQASVLRQMPAWEKGIAHGLFLVPA
ncbi:MAG: hypothetical protein AAGJ35_07345, partial [Myxococcota bacterium]